MTTLRRELLELMEQADRQEAIDRLEPSRPPDWDGTRIGVAQWKAGADLSLDASRARRRRDREHRRDKRIELAIGALAGLILFVAPIIAAVESGG